MTADLAGWLGRERREDDVVALPLVRRLAALLDREPASFRAGDALPPGWHAILFAPLAVQRELGPDGHPRLGDFLPPVDLPRRMLGGRRMRFHSPLLIGAPVIRTSRIDAITPKHGRTGRMVVVTVRHDLVPDGAEAASVTEEQDIVYREAAPPQAGKASSLPPPARPRDPAHSRTVRPDATMLFRYSAATNNAHRIHYDLPYASGVEGYPALVVNGGLTALLLLELLHGAAGAAAREFHVRNVRPLFCDHDLRLCAEPDAERWRLWAEDDQMRTAVDASATCG